MIDIKERDRLKELTDKLKEMKDSSEAVREWLSINNELLKQKKLLLNLREGSTLYKVKARYIKVLTITLAKMKRDSKEVEEYIKTSEKVLSTLSSRSSFMKGIKNTYPELHAWIALNKKRAYYEELILNDVSNHKCFENLSELNSQVKRLNEINVELQNFRKQYPESVAEWESLYRLKSILRQ